MHCKFVSMVCCIPSKSTESSLIALMHFIGLYNLCLCKLQTIVTTLINTLFYIFFMNKTCFTSFITVDDISVQISMSSLHWEAILAASYKKPLHDCCLSQSLAHDTKDAVDEVPLLSQSMMSRISV